MILSKTEFGVYITQKANKKDTSQGAGIFI